MFPELGTRGQLLFDSQVCGTESVACPHPHAVCYNNKFRAYGCLVHDVVMEGETVVNTGEKTTFDECFDSHKDVGMLGFIAASLRHNNECLLFYNDAWVSQAELNTVSRFWYCP